MLPAVFESTRPLFDLASRAPEPLALLALGAGLIALSFGLRARPARPVEPAPAPPSAVRARISASSPLATQQGQS
jgi:hypothetical protein